MVGECWIHLSRAEEEATEEEEQENELLLVFNDTDMSYSYGWNDMTSKCSIEFQQMQHTQ